jgi:D-alanyl-D-alanine carboxypeptidase
VERAAGDRLEHQLRSRILRPLGLHDSYLASSGRSRDGDHLAHGYEPDAAHIGPLLEQFGTPPGTRFFGAARPDHVDVTGNNPTYTWAAGSMVATPRDWDRFLTALVSGRLLPPAQLAQMRTTVEDPTSKGTVRYGLGLMRYTGPCGTVWGHTGGIPGFGSQNYTDETGRRSVSVVTTTQFGAKSEAVMAADQRVVDAAVCTMLGRPIPVS